ncbi:nucleoside recognition domain-containing protein [Candidatus Thiothrix anitrata]|uniref:nucleoside recognition domain-containing protein n=1 Tax=Candidatus Thiothrix anitrata TaxID=2823902 RepID=UPI002B1BE319|nr:nucleoside recognition domain-containing protein [Candidatus Thiothrix anitrata]
MKSFIVKAGRIIVPMVLVLNVLNALGTDGSFGNEDSDKSVLAEVGVPCPAFSPMGLHEDNWPAAVGIFTGVLAKEAVVGTLDAAYTALGKQDAAEAGTAAEEATPFSLPAGIAAAFATIPTNLAGALGTWTDPLGVNVGDVSDQNAVAEEQGLPTARLVQWRRGLTGLRGHLLTCCSSCCIFLARRQLQRCIRSPGCAGRCLWLGGQPGWVTGWRRCITKVRRLHGIRVRRVCG